MIAAQLYTVRDRLHDRHQLVEVLGRLREVASLGPDAADHSGEELTRAGLKACAAHESLERLTADLSAVAGRCRVWGFPARPVRNG